MDPVGISMGKQEKLTLLMLAVLAAGSLYTAWRLFLVQVPVDGDFSSRFFWLYVIGYVYVVYRDGSVMEDERDRQIALKRRTAGFAALALMLVVVTAILDLSSYEEFVKSRSRDWLSNFIGMMIMVAMTIDAAVGAWYYWSDRR